MATDYTPQLLEEMHGFLEALTDAMLENEQRATGKSIASLNVQSPKPGVAQLLGGGQFEYLHRGRGPTPDGTPAGEPTLLEAIKEWIAAKGLTINPFAVTRKIHALGTALHRGEDYRYPGRRISTTFEKVINPQTIGDLTARLATASQRVVKSELLDIFNP